ncbi:MAG: hypothetical protein ACOYM0_01355 [Bacteroidales bacterium]
MKKEKKKLAREMKWILDHIEMIDWLIAEFEKEGIFNPKRKNPDDGTNHPLKPHYID